MKFWMSMIVIIGFIVWINWYLDKRKAEKASKDLEDSNIEALTFPHEEANIGTKFAMKGRQYTYKIVRARDGFFLYSRISKDGKRTFKSELKITHDEFNALAIIIK